MHDCHRNCCYSHYIHVASQKLLKAETAKKTPTHACHRHCSPATLFSPLVCFTEIARGRDCQKSTHTGIPQTAHLLTLLPSLPRMCISQKLLEAETAKKAAVHVHCRNCSHCYCCYHVFHRNCWKQRQPKRQLCWQLRPGGMQGTLHALCARTQSTHGLCSWPSLR